MRLVGPVFKLSLTLPSCSAPTDTAIPHFSKVNDSLYRGGRPKPSDLSYLRSLNVRTVINLQGGDLNNPRYRAIMKLWEPGELADAIAAEKKLSESLGLLFFSKPLDAIDPVSDEDDARIDEILQIMGNRATQPVFIHCERGVDRTGLIIALYEAKYMGMPPDDAYNDWRASGHRGIGALFTGHLDEYYWRKLGLPDPRSRVTSGKSPTGPEPGECDGGSTPRGRPIIAEWRASD
jgi:protein tyrosine/serine phosphatase